jgi:hypothetical protein
MSPAVLDDADFRTAVAYAKGIAKQNEAKELSPQLLLFGFALASRAGKLAAKFEELSGCDAVTDLAASTAGLNLSTEVEPFDRALIPTDTALRELLMTAGGSAGAFVNALLKSIDLTNAKSSDLMKSFDAISKEEGFSDTVRFASVVGRRHGLKDISPELLAVGAFLAFRAGLLRKRPSVAPISPPTSAASKRSLKLRAGCTRSQHWTKLRCLWRQALRSHSEKERMIAIR